MKKTGMRIFAYVAIALMLGSIVPLLAMAETDSLQDRIKDRDRINATTNVSGEKIATQIKQAMSTQERYGEATANFLSIKANNSALNTEEAIEATREYLNSTIDMMTESLDNEEYIEMLNAEKEDVAAAGTREEFAECANDIREIWREARQEKINSTSSSANNKLKAVIKASETMSLRLENEISRLEMKGKDVTELQEMNQEYSALIAEADKYQKQAEEAFGNDSSESFKYMKQAGQSLKQANAVLENMLMELKQYREGIVAFSDESTLTAEGDGIAVVSGDFAMSFTADNATLVIKDMEGNAVINTDDATYEYSNTDAGNSDVDNMAYVYHNLTGDVTIEGTRLTVTLHGTDISLDVEGTGNAVLTGEGTYEINGEKNTWTAPDEENSADEEIASGESNETE